MDIKQPTRNLFVFVYVKTKYIVRIMIIKLIKDASVFFNVKLEEPMNNLEKSQIFYLNLSLKLRSTTVSMNIIARSK